MHFKCYIFLLILGPLSVNAQYASVSWKESYDSAQLYWQKDIQKSVTLLRQAEEVAFNDLGIYDQNYLTILNDLGLAYGQINDYRKADEYLTKSLAIQHELYSEENENTLTSACNLATVILKSGNDLRARQLYKDILVKAQAIETGTVYTTAAENLTNLYEVHEQYDSALIILRQALETHFANPLLENEFKFRLSEGRILRRMKRFTESSNTLTVLSKSVSSSALTIPTLRYSIQIEQSLIHLETGLYIQAEKELLELYRTLKGESPLNEMLLVEVTNALAFTYEKLEVYDRALYYNQESLGYCLKNYGYNSLNCAIMQNNMAGIYLKQGFTQQAISQYEEFINTYISLSSQSTTLYFTALNNLATAYRQTGQYEKALNHLNKIYGSMNASGRGETDLAATIMNNIAVTFMLQGKHDAAIRNFEIVLKMKESFYGVDSPVLLDVIENLGVTYWAAGQPEKALPLFRRSLKLTERQIRFIFPHLTESEQVQFYTRQKQNFERFNTLVVQHGEKFPDLVTEMFDNQLLLKSIIFFTNKKRSEQARGNEQAKMLIGLSAARSVQLGHLYQLPSDVLSTLGTTISKLENEIDSLEKVIRHALTEDAPVQQHVTWADIRNSLKADETSVDIIRFRKYDILTAKSVLAPKQVSFGFTDSVFYALLITSAETIGHPKLILLKNGNQLEGRNYRYYMNSMRFNFEDLVSYTPYWLPIERELTGKKTIYITADGVYHQMNLNVLQDPTGKFILEKFDLHVLLNQAQLIKRNETRKIDFSKSVLMGDPIFTLSSEQTARGWQYEPLPGSLAEIKGIVAALKLSPTQGTIYLRQAASEVNLKKVHSPSILHIATHGFFSTELVYLNEQAKGDFMFHSGLILSSSNLKERTFENDGVVTAYEVMNLDLSKTELVVLSACETGLGRVENSEGVYGLQRSFLQAGASIVVISLWKVEDEMTKNLMVKFYGYIGQRKSQYEALKLAQLDMLREVEKPWLWGAFVMVRGN